MNELNNYEQHSPSDEAARRSGLIATGVYVVVMVVALCFTRCDLGSLDDELNDSANMLLISFGESEVGSDVLAKNEIQQITPPRPTPPQVEESQQLTDEQSEVAEYVEPKEEPVEEPKPVVEREKPREGDSIPPVETPQLNERALFPGSSPKESENRGQEEHTSGITGTHAGLTEEFSPLGEGLTANYTLSGRSLVGSLPIPNYGANAEGRVVINITVDDLGRVTSASLRTNGSTTNNSTLIESARKAALKARFTPSDDFVQSGTITYIFKMN
ncbi:MAG: TonB family protein [Rikenellaceae bacterium]